MKNMSPLPPLVIDGPASDILAAMRKRVAQSNASHQKGGYAARTIEAVKEVDDTLAAFVTQDKTVSPTSQRHLFSRFLELATRGNIQYDHAKNPDILHQLVDELAQNINALQNPSGNRQGTQHIASRDTGKLVIATVTHGALIPKLKEEFPGNTNNIYSQAFLLADPQSSLRQRTALKPAAEAEKPIEHAAAEEAPVQVASQWAQLLGGGDSEALKPHTGNVTVNRLKGGGRRY